MRNLETRCWYSQLQMSGRRHGKAFWVIPGCLLFLSCSTCWVPGGAGASLSSPPLNVTTSDLSIRSRDQQVQLSTDERLSRGALGTRAEQDCCKEFYGMLPCSNSLPGSFFLMLVYGGLLLFAAKLISDGSELLLEVLDPGVVGGLVLPVLGALPDAFIIGVSGLAGSLQEAQVEVAVGMGTLAGSTVMLLSATWGASLLVGRCDIGDSGRAVDGTRTAPYDLWSTGVTTDSSTPHNAWIMLASTLPLLLVQAPILMHEEDYSQQAALVGLILCMAMLSAYCVYQVLVPELQLQRMKAARERFVSSYSIRSMHHLAVKHGSAALIRCDGSVNEQALQDIFERFDVNGDRMIDRNEVKMLVCALTFGAQGFIPRESDVEFYLRHFDTDLSDTISLPEFIAGMQRWISQVEYEKHLVRKSSAPGLCTPRHSDHTAPHSASSAQRTTRPQSSPDDSSHSSTTDGTLAAPPSAGSVISLPPRPPLPRLIIDAPESPPGKSQWNTHRNFGSNQYPPLLASLENSVPRSSSLVLPSPSPLTRLPVEVEDHEEAAEDALGRPLLSKRAISRRSQGSQEKSKQREGEGVVDEEEESEEGSEEVTASEGEDEEGKFWLSRKSRTVAEAVVILACGSLALAVFSGPLVDSVSGFARLSGIPAFFVSFVVTPLASNASELYSSLVFASGMKRKNMTLTFSQVYGAVTMNNTLCLGVFLALIVFRGIQWDFSAEVTVLLFVIIVVGIVGSSRTTFRAWLAFPVFSLYPLSLSLVAFLDYGLHWH